MKFKITRDSQTRNYVTKKFISNSLIVGLLFNSILHSFAGTLSEDRRYETFEGNDITINNILEEDVVDVEIEGNTVVNLLPYSHESWKGNIANNIRWSIYRRYSLVQPLKPNTTYTLMIAKKPENGAYLYFCYSVDGTHIFETGYKKCDRLVFTTPPDTPSGTEYSCIPHIKGENNNIEMELLSNSVECYLLEGDWGNKEIPAYFEGIKSVGQDDKNNHEVTILSKNKNILPSSGGWVDGQIMTGGNLNTSDVHSTCSIATSDYIKLKGDTTYTFSYPDAYQVAYHTWSLSLDYIKDSGWMNYKTITPSDDCYIKVTVRLNGSYNGTLEQAQSMPTHPSHVGNNLTIQLEERDVATAYTIGETNETKIVLNEPLRGLPNGTKDRIMKKNGQWYIERNCGEINLTGIENYEYSLTGLNKDILSVRCDSFDIKRNSYSIANNLLKDTVPLYSTDNTAGRLNSYFLGYEDYNLIRFYISNFNTINEYKEYFKNNHISVIYELKTPIYEPLNVDSVIDIYLDTTHISSNSTIPAKMKVTVDRVANRAKESIELLNSNPTIDNISQARYWSNLMKESTLKDNFQSEISNITDIEDLTIEKKTASVNTDIYIKMKNTLSLSLDTNSIIFDEVDITEDTEKLKAVNLTVSSSLPYKINAYLEDEIYNSDKSEILDKSVLNIKANKDTTYQAFSDLSNPIILLDDQEAGTEITHGVDLKLASNDTYKADIYKTTIKFEVVQK